MNDEKSIMKIDTVLPADFDGVFKFSNWTDEDFTGVWGGTEYLFPSKSTSPMVIPQHSPLEIQHIRKKFAKDLAEREYAKSKEYKMSIKQERNNDGTPRLNGIQQAATYSINELSVYIQKCLEPLENKTARVTQKPKDQIEDKLSRNDEGGFNTEAIDRKSSLKSNALSA